MDAAAVGRALAAGPDAAYQELGWETSHRASRITDLSEEERAVADEVRRRRIGATLAWLDDAVMAPLC